MSVIEIFFIRREHPFSFQTKARSYFEMFAFGCDARPLYDLFSVYSILSHSAFDVWRCDQGHPQPIMLDEEARKEVLNFVEKHLNIDLTM